MGQQQTLFAALVLGCVGSLVAGWLLAAPVSGVNRAAVDLDTGELLPVYTGLAEFAKK
jgi:uncharacterized membrane protein YeaQ/YmgE (transglycosylase-associated protein family)